MPDKITIGLNFDSDEIIPTPLTSFISTEENTYELMITETGDFIIQE